MKVKYKKSNNRRSQWHVNEEKNQFEETTGEKSVKYKVKVAVTIGLIKENDLGKERLER